MFDKKEMKLIKGFDKAKEYCQKGIPVYMVRMDGSLVELTEDTDWRLLLFHNLKGGSYAIYRKKHNEGDGFHKEFRIGKRRVVVEHAREGGGASWRFASYREEQ